MEKLWGLSQNYRIPAWFYTFWATINTRHSFWTVLLEQSSTILWWERLWALDFRINFEIGHILNFFNKCHIYVIHLHEIHWKYLLWAWHNFMSTIFVLHVNSISSALKKTWIFFSSIIAVDPLDLSYILNNHEIYVKLYSLINVS